jgi:hypothetical protein
VSLLQERCPPISYTVRVFLCCITQRWNNHVTKLMFLSRKGNRHVSLPWTWRNSQIITNLTASSLTFWRCQVSLHHYSADRNAHETSFIECCNFATLCDEQRGTWLASQWHAAFIAVPNFFYSFARPFSVYGYTYTSLTP